MKATDGIAVDVLLIGFLERDSDGKVIPERTSSSSVLVRCPGHNIVVDTGSPFMAAGIKTSFKQIGVFRDDVDTVILTHNHPDHAGNVKLFPKAKVLVHEGEEPYPGATVVTGDVFEVCKGVRMVHTPGHTPGSCSVFVTADREYVIAGDTCPLKANYAKMTPPALNCDEALARASLEKVVDAADVIIPGHEGPFFTRKAGGKPKQRKR